MFMNSVLWINICLVFFGYPKDSVYYDDSNKKRLGKMKDEFNGVRTDEFVGLKSKMYSLIAENDLEVNKGKGTNLLLKHSMLMFCLVGGGL